MEMNGSNGFKKKTLLDAYLERIDDFNVSMHDDEEKAVECFEDTKELIDGRSLQEVWLIWETVSMVLIEYARETWDDWDFESFVSCMRLSVSYLRMMEDGGIEAAGEKYGFDPNDLDDNPGKS